MKLLELFKGTGSVGKVAKKLGYDVISLDFEEKYKPDILVDILKWNYKDFPTPDYIWASPPCNTFSPLVYPLKERNIETAEPYSERAKLGTEILHQTLKIIKYFLNKNPKLKFCIENPHGMMRKDPKMMKLPMETTRYCMYGDEKTKPTDFWSNYPLDLKQGFCRGTVRTDRAPTIEQRYRMPPKLIKQILLQSQKEDNVKVGLGKETPKVTINKEALAEVKAEALGDDDIRRFLGNPDAKIIDYSKLEGVPSIDALLPNPGDYCIILYEDSQNHGHWTVVNKFARKVGGRKKGYYKPRLEEDEFVLPFSESKGYEQWGFGKPLENSRQPIIQFFDSYGGKPDSQLKWVSEPMREELGQKKPLLTMLFDKCPYAVYFNDVEYQKESPNISNCGRHCVNFIRASLEKEYDLRQYYEWMKACCKKLNTDYDGVVSILIQ